MKTAQRRICAIAFACLTLTAIAPAAFAQQPEREVKVRIFRGDLDLSTEAGARTALRRIELATTQICGQRPGHLLIRAQRSWRRCHEEFVARAVEAFDAPRLTDLYLDSLAEPGQSTKRRA